MASIGKTEEFFDEIPEIILEHADVKRQLQDVTDRLAMKKFKNRKEKADEYLKLGKLMTMLLKFCPQLHNVK